MTIASSISPSTKERLRPYWNAYKRLRAKYDIAKERITLPLRTLTRKVVQRAMPVRARKAANGRLNLHIGCGRFDHPQFVNIDGYPFAHVHFVQSIERLDRFRTGSVDLIYASHCLEHIRYRGTVAVLAEWQRALKPGGVLRLSVPDFDTLVDVYMRRGRDADVVMTQLMGGQNSRYNFHYTLLGEVNLTRALHSAGFATVRRWQPGDSELTSFPDWSAFPVDFGDRSQVISLNLEAVK